MAGFSRTFWGPPKGGHYTDLETALAGRRSACRAISTCSFRFFPLVEHEELGLTLHPFGLATNKVLALIGRLEVETGSMVRFRGP